MLSSFYEVEVVVNDSPIFYCRSDPEELLPGGKLLTGAALVIS